MCDCTFCDVRDLPSTVFNAIYLVPLAIERRTRILQGFAIRAKISLHSVRRHTIGIIVSGIIYRTRDRCVLFNFAWKKLHLTHCFLTTETKDFIGLLSDTVKCANLRRLTRDISGGKLDGNNEEKYQAKLGLNSLVF